MFTDVSLWSANLANLEAEIQRIDPFADGYHIDVCDGHFAPSLLFFPDLVRALRPLTKHPFHVHLMVENPVSMIADFVDAGADLITVHAESGEPHKAIDMIRKAGRQAGLALKLETPVDACLPFAGKIDALLLLGTALGVKGQDLAPQACDRLRQAAAFGVRLTADGGIRSSTVPLLAEAGAYAVVPGSLAFQSKDLAATFAWLKGQ